MNGNFAARSMYEHSYAPYSTESYKEKVGVYVKRPMYGITEINPCDQENPRRTIVRNIDDPNKISRSVPVAGVYIRS